MNHIEELKNLPKKNDFFIGIDSDGCVFDTMEIKHKECFCPAFIKHMNLQAASKYAREVWEFVNLYSKTRGSNRFLAVQHSMKLISERKEFAERNIQVSDYPSLKAWINEESKLGNPALEKRVAMTDNKELLPLLDWSKEVNERIEDMVYGISPFPGVKDLLQKANGKADMIVVSQTPVEALEREWRENKIDKYVSLIAGQEYGTKTEHLKYAADGKYDTDKVLMLGDAPGDLKAARSNNALFFPIIPGEEEKSWQNLLEEGIDKFFKGEFAGQYQQNLIEGFDKALPEKPNW